ncbi:hypothetical protein BDW02DRAFT_214071 [Decorospora gaudefroyi]|uniref:Uncharacterized protein n=1 Tax=Decorospora gaudefroyi TaxID=184978 RepID=A0A6A5KKS0_9PLEO|nr:hypothetical protein BDW02DRAFT_214071 [Decorospora gaudefroyi]
MSRPTTAAMAARLLLVSLPLSIAYPQMLPPFELLNATTAPVPMPTAAPDVAPIYNDSDSQPVFIDPVPDPVFEPVDEPGCMPPLDPIYVDPMFPDPPIGLPEPPSMSIKTLLSIMQPLLDLIAQLLPPDDDSMVRPLPAAAMTFGLGPMEKRDVAPDLPLPVGALTGTSVLAGLMQTVVDAIKGLLMTTPAGPVLGPVTEPVETIVGTASPDAVPGNPLSTVTGAAPANVIPENLVDTVTNAVPISAIPGNPLNTVTGAAPANVIPGNLVDTVTNAVPISGIPGNPLNSVTGAAPANVIPGNLGGITGRALRARQLDGIGGVVGSTDSLIDTVKQAVGGLPVGTSNILSTGAVTDPAKDLLEILTALLSSFGSPGTHKKRSALVALVQHHDSSSNSLSSALESAPDELTKRQDFGIAFVKNYIKEFHFLYPVLQSTSPQFAAGLINVLYDPTIAIPSMKSLDMSHLPDRVRKFIIDTYYFSSILEDPAVSYEDKTSIILALLRGLEHYKRSAKRDMRRGERKRLDEGAMLDEDSWVKFDPYHVDESFLSGVPAPASEEHECL